MPVQPAVRDLLKRGHVPYQTFTHRLAYTAQEEAAAAHVPGRDWAKTVACVADMARTVLRSAWRPEREAPSDRCARRAG